MSIKGFYWLCIFCLSISSQLKAQLSEQAEISILTCRQGDDIYNTFGHTAIWIQDPTSRKNELFNYGMFNFKEPGFTMKFLRGKLLYYLGMNSYKGFMNNYTAEKRSIFVQNLNLNTEQKNKLYQSLLVNYKKENRYYLYDFFFDNCCTRTIDLIEEAIPELNYAPKKEEQTFRQLLDEYTFAKPWTDFGIDLIIGAKADKVTTLKDQMFLPEYLYQNLEAATVNGQSIVKSSELILDYEAEVTKRQKKPWFTPVLLFGLLFLVELFLLFKFKNGDLPLLFKLDDTIWFTLLGLGSLVVLFMWFGTDHIATKNNFNVLWLNPLFLIPAIRRKKAGIILLMVFLILALLCNVAFQQFHVASLIIIAITLVKLLRQSQSQQIKVSSSNKLT